MLSEDKREKIALEVIRILWGRHLSFEEAKSNRNAPFHEAFLVPFESKLVEGLDIPQLISLSSWLHGLETTMGQTFFENVAHILSGGDKVTFSKKRAIV